jgi:hypothetical protein
MQHTTTRFLLARATELFIFDVDSLFYHLDGLTERMSPMPLPTGCRCASICSLTRST